MSFPATLLFVYFVVGVLFALVAVIAKKKEDGFWSSYPWAAEPALFAVAIAFWPVTILLLMFSGSTKKNPRPEGPIQPPQRNAGSRPSSDDSPASEAPSSLGPRG